MEQKLFQSLSSHKNCNEVILILDKLEEQRPLFIQEKNMRKIIKIHMAKLLKYKNSYWRQRYTERWVVFGDECTKFLYAAATNRFRHIVISFLTNDDGISFCMGTRKKLLVFGRPSKKGCQFLTALSWSSTLQI
jgi:hypothetical protein